MKFEKLNSEKFKSLDNEELGRLCGGAKEACGYTESDKDCVSNNNGSGGTTTNCYSNDWTQTTTDELGQTKTRKVFDPNGGDITAQKLCDIVDVNVD